MGNASNNVVLMGIVANEVQFYSTKKGVEFAAKFILDVKKGYKTASGNYAKDFIPVRIKGENRMGFARTIHKGDRICVSGSVASENYEAKNGAKIYSVIIDADQIEWTGKNQFTFGSSEKPVSKKKSSGTTEKSKTAENEVTIDLNFADLPFK